MNSKSTQIWITLRHLALVCVIVVGVLSILATGGSSGVTTAPPAGSSNWDEMIWDQDQWA